MSCNCYIARHPLAAKIDAALLAMEDPRSVAERFNVGKSRVYEHRSHLKTAGAAFVAVARPETQEAPAPRPEPEEPVKAEPAPAERHREATPAESPEIAPRVEWRSAAPKVEPPSLPASSAAPPRPEVPREPPPAVIPRVDAVHGIVESSVPQSESGEAPKVHTEDAGPVRALPVSTAQTGYLEAVDTCLELITQARWLPSHIRGISEKLGLSVDRVRHAYSEATRHMQLDMGGYMQKHATSVAWIIRHRNDAKTKAETAATHAERWRRQEREAQEHADKKTGDERIATLKEAAHFGMLATKYDLSAEKWSAQALSHQRHLDDVLCLRGPKEATQNVFNISANDMAKFEAFGRAMAARFASQPDILRAIEEAAGAVMLAVSGDAAAITTTGEAA